MDFEPFKGNQSEGDEAMVRRSTRKEGYNMIQLNWDNIVIQTTPPTGCCGKKNPDAKPKVILDDVSGCVLPGQFLSIIGASGAGKTTLLNFLSGRLISKNLDKQGEIFVNGVDRNAIKGFSSYCAYV